MGFGVQCGTQSLKGLLWEASTIILNAIIILNNELLPFVFMEKSEHCTALRLQAPHLERFHKAVVQAHPIPHIDLQTKATFRTNTGHSTSWRGGAGINTPVCEVCVEDL